MRHTYNIKLETSEVAKEVIVRAIREAACEIRQIAMLVSSEHGYARLVKLSNDLDQAAAMIEKTESMA